MYSTWTFSIPVSIGHSRVTTQSSKGGWKRSVHDVVIKWKHFARYRPFVRGIQWSPVDSLHKGHWRGAWCSFDLRLNKRFIKHSGRRWFESYATRIWLKILCSLELCVIMEIMTRAARVLFFKHHWTNLRIITSKPSLRSGLTISFALSPRMLDKQRLCKRVNSS